MKKSDTETFARSISEQSAESAGSSVSVGILVQDPTNRRLIESVASQLELTPTLLDESSLNAGLLHRLGLIIADESIARRIRSVLQGGEEQADRLNPALIAVRSRDSGPLPAVATGGEQEFEGIIVLPQEPAATLAQLSVILYTHRAFAWRYQSALEELHLNRRIFRSVTNGITVADAGLPDMPLVYVNPAFEVMTGYSLEEVQGRNCRFLQGEDRQQPGLALIREAIRTQREVVVVLKNYRKDGTAFWNELSVSPIRNREGELTHYVGIQMDVTSRVEFEAALRESEKLAAVGRLAASIAHEINNPLESVMNLLYLAEHSDEMSEMKKYMEMADKELQRVALITSQSLRFYKQSTSPQAVRPSAMLGSVLELYQAKLDSARITVERRERATEPIVCLESEIRQVLSNLVRNAIEAMHGVDGCLRIRVREAVDRHTGARGVVMTVADTGSGISAETKKHLGQAFYTTKGMGGTGLGLWVSKEIVQRHKGWLLVRSSQRPGDSWTLFQLFLPYAGVTT